jgi:hypothetical protein
MPMHAARERIAGRTGLGVTIGLALAAVGSWIACPAAQAGAWAQVSCVNPDGSGAGSQGWVAMVAGGGYGSNTDTNCGPGAPAFAILSNDAAVPVGAAETLRYIPPAGSTLDGGRIDVGLLADGRGYGASGTAVAYSPEYAYNGSNVFFQCASGLTPCTPGSYDFTGELEVPAGRGGELYLSAGCGGIAGQSCNEGGSEGAWSLVRLYSAQLTLANSSSPAGSGFGGTLLAGNARGSRDVTFTASDLEGPGVYRVAVQADGATLYDGTPDANGGACVPVGVSGARLMFDAAQPCKRSETIDLSLDTTGLPDGTHTLKVTVTDAAQNSSVVYDSVITTQNAPLSTTPPSIGEAAPQTGETLTGEAGTWSGPAHAGPISYAYRWQSCDPAAASCRSIPGAQGVGYTASAVDVGHSLRLLVTASNADGASTVASAPSGVVTGTASVGGAALAEVLGTPNGRGASQQAQVRIREGNLLVRRYDQRALTLHGALSDLDGTPIVGATLDVLARPAAGGGEALLGRITTAADGTFSANVLAGPSRRVVVGYRAFTGAPQYSAQAALTETVTSGVTLQVTPRRTASDGTITLSGRVAGPLPAHGVVVELLVHYRGAWEPFRDPHTSVSGRFSVRYHFEGAVGRFPFRAKVLGEQSGFPYATGLSRVVHVQSG